jgi:hypothetical protein
MRTVRKTGMAVLTLGLSLGLVTGCSAAEDLTSNDPSQAQESPVVDEESQSTPDGAASSAEAFVKAFEAEGLGCVDVDEDRWGPGVVEQVLCRGGDSVVVTIRNFEDAAALDAQLNRVQEQACNVGFDQRLATSGTWILMVGGDREVDYEVFGNSIATLGLDSEDYICSE